MHPGLEGESRREIVALSASGDHMHLDSRGWARAARANSKKMQREIPIGAA